MKTILISGVLFTLMISSASFAEPQLVYLSAHSGPNHGFEGSTTRGAAITVWGRHLGQVDNNSSITIAGVTLNSTSDSVVEWGATTNPTTAKDFQRITFFLDSSMPKGNSDGIYVTVDGVISNTLPFLIQQDGSESRILFLTPEENFGLFTHQLQPGDFIYMRAGNYSNLNELNGSAHEWIGYWEGQCDTWIDPPVNGTDAMRISLTSYPGELGVFYNASIINYSDYWTIANVHFYGSHEENNYQYTMGSQWSHCSYCQDHSVGLRTVGNEFTGNARIALDVFGDDFEIDANYFDVNPMSNTGYLLYLCSGVNRQVRDNEMHGGAMYTMHVWDEQRCWDAHVGREMTNFNFEGNWVEASNRNGYPYRSGFIIGTAHDIPIRNITLKNNIFWGTHAGVTANDSAIRFSMGVKNNVHVYNNTIVGFPRGIFFDWRNDNSDFFVKNNIFQDISGIHFETQNAPVTGLEISHNIYGKEPEIQDGSDDFPIVTDEPGFVDKQTGNFRLLERSAAIDSGVILAKVTYDYDGNPRPMEDGQDIGAFEFPGEYVPDDLAPAPPANLSVVLR